MDFLAPSTEFSNRCCLAVEQKQQQEEALNLGLLILILLQQHIEEKKKTKRERLWKFLQKIRLTTWAKIKISEVTFHVNAAFYQYQTNNNKREAEKIK